MDDLDQDILAYFELVNPFASSESVGRRFGVSGTTVAARWRAMEERGVIQGACVFPAAVNLGKVRRYWIFRGVDRTTVDMRAVLDVEELAACFWVYPDIAVVCSYHTQSNPPVPEPLVRALGGELIGGSNPPELASTGHPPAPGSSIDLRVLRALLKDPRASDSELAMSSGMATRTFRRHRASLIPGGQATVYLILDMTREHGVINYMAWAHVLPSFRPEELGVTGLRTLVRHTEPPAVYLYGHGRSYVETKEIESKLKEFPNLEELSFWIPQGGAFATRRVESWLDEALERWKLARFDKRVEPNA